MNKQYIQPQFDYTNQAWTVLRDGQRIYIRCGHPSPDCGCFGKTHDGEPVPQSELQRIMEGR